MIVSVLLIFLSFDVPEDPYSELFEPHIVINSVDPATFAEMSATTARNSQKRKATKVG